MKRKFPLFVLLLSLLPVAIPSGIIEAQMMGEAPIVKKAPGTKQATQAPPPAAGKTTQEQTQKDSGIQPVTSNDYKYYAKEGHRSSKWNEYVQPGFQTFDSGNLATSSIFLKKAYDLGCRDALVLFRLGIYNEYQGKYPEAATLLKLAADDAAARYADHPISKAVYKHLGRALYQAGDLNGAIVQLTQALRFEPDDFTALFLAGQILNQMNEPEKARVALEKAYTLQPSGESSVDLKKPLLHELIVATSNVKDFDAAARYIEEMLAAYPGDPLAMKYKGQLQEIMRKKRENEMLKKLSQ
jgi:tetratricopeptide (TPR) repeat protein